MEQPKAPGSPKKGEGHSRLCRGKIRNRIIWEFFRSLAALARPGRMNGGGSSATTTPTSSSAYTSEATSDA